GLGEADGVVFVDGEEMALGDGATFGLGAGVGDFLVAASAVEHAIAARQAVTRWNLFFMGRVCG
ncbi:MAG: hypothetical protein DME70_02845, partial [Verrucomicrobia bacterium]